MDSLRESHLRSSLLCYFKVGTISLLPPMPFDLLVFMTAQTGQRASYNVHLPIERGRSESSQFVALFFRRELNWKMDTVLSGAFKKGFHSYDIMRDPAYGWKIGHFERETIK